MCINPPCRQFSLWSRGMVDVCKWMGVELNPEVTWIAAHGWVIHESIHTNTHTAHTHMHTHTFTISLWSRKSQQQWIILLYRKQCNTCWYMAFFYVRVAVRATNNKCKRGNSYFWRFVYNYNNYFNIKWAANVSVTATFSKLLQLFPSPTCILYYKWNICYQIK